MNDETTLNGMVSERWCLHIPGPDDLYPVRSREEAEALKVKHDAAMRTFWDHQTAKYPTWERYAPPLECSIAQIIPWPHSPMSDEAWERACAEAGER